MRSRAGSSAPQAVAIIPQRGRWRAERRCSGSGRESGPRARGACSGPRRASGVVPRFGGRAARPGRRRVPEDHRPLQTEAFSFVESIPRVEALHLVACSASFDPRGPRPSENCAESAHFPPRRSVDDGNARQACVSNRLDRLLRAAAQRQRWRSKSFDRPKHALGNAHRRPYPHTRRAKARGVLHNEQLPRRPRLLIQRRRGGGRNPRWNRRLPQ